MFEQSFFRVESDVYSASATEVTQQLQPFLLALLDEIQKLPTISHCCDIFGRFAVVCIIFPLKRLRSFLKV